MGFRVLVSLHPAIQATGRLTFAPAGLTPAEHTSLRWTHKRTQFMPLVRSVRETHHLANVVRQCPLWVRSRHSHRKKSCPLYPRKRTCAMQLGMSAMGQKRALAPRRDCFRSNSQHHNPENKTPGCYTGSFRGRFKLPHPLAALLCGDEAHSNNVSDLHRQPFFLGCARVLAWTSISAMSWPAHKAAARGKLRAVCYSASMTRYKGRQSAKAVERDFPHFLVVA
jgi:hypothetical protein